jgi:hypothetical protein
MSCHVMENVVMLIENIVNFMEYVVKLIKSSKTKCSKFGGEHPTPTWSADDEGERENPTTVCSFICVCGERPRRASMGFVWLATRPCRTGEGGRTDVHLNPFLDQVCSQNGLPWTRRSVCVELMFRLLIVHLFAWRKWTAAIYLRRTARNALRSQPYNSFLFLHTILWDFCPSYSFIPKMLLCATKPTTRWWCQSTIS